MDDIPEYLDDIDYKREMDVLEMLENKISPKNGFMSSSKSLNNLIYKNDIENDAVYESDKKNNIILNNSKSINI
jgi:hypothetical protein